MLKPVSKAPIIWMVELKYRISVTELHDFYGKPQSFFFITKTEINVSKLTCLTGVEEKWQFNGRVQLRGVQQTVDVVQKWAVRIFLTHQVEPHKYFRVFLKQIYGCFHIVEYVRVVFCSEYKLKRSLKYYKRKWPDTSSSYSSPFIQFEELGYNSVYQKIHCQFLFRIYVL